MTGSDGPDRGNEPGADYGLFGPASVTWRLMTEPVMWVAGARALYLQALHPRVMQGTWQNSAFARSGEAWGRFVRTIDFVETRTYGTLPEVERAGRRLRHIHASLTGVDDEGRVFRLDEPDLLLWVHCAEVSSLAEVARRCGMGVRQDELDAFVAEQRRSAVVVGLDAAMAPGSMRELDAYYQRMRPQLRACAEARRALRLSFTPRLPLPLTPLRLLVPPLNVLAYASLPGWARQLYGTPGSPLTDGAVTLALRAAYEASTRIPPRLLYVPGAANARSQMRAEA
jgi:uncharacterized protein (DUF2236 family)